ncbi:hypothetical protein ACTHGU_00490 [Chitinophagaceae bacterium MMS25-I14]
MKKLLTSYLLFPAALIGLLGSCGHNNNAPGTPGGGQIKAATDGSTVWEGKINNRIPVLVRIRYEADSSISGEVIYTAVKHPEPILLLSSGHTSEPGKIYLQEFSKKGDITGMWSGTIKNRHFTGKWYGKKDLPFDLVQKDTAWTGKDLKAKEIEDGSYSFQYPDEGAMGEFTIHRINDRQAEFEISVNRGAPSYNMGDIYKDTISVDGNKAVYTQSDTTYGHCAFTLSFYNGYALINYNEDAYECGFGMGVTVDGIYIKTSDSVIFRKPDL